MPALAAPEVVKLLLESGSARHCGAGIRTERVLTRGQRKNLMALTEPLEDLAAQGRLKEIPGVGDAMADIVTKLHQKGSHPALDAMRKEM